MGVRYDYYFFMFKKGNEVVLSLNQDVPSWISERSGCLAQVIMNLLLNLLFPFSIYVCWCFLELSLHQESINARINVKTTLVLCISVLNLLYLTSTPYFLLLALEASNFVYIDNPAMRQITS